MEGASTLLDTGYMINDVKHKLYIINHSYNLIHELDDK